MTSRIPVIILVKNSLWNEGNNEWQYKLKSNLNREIEIHQ